MLLQERHQVVGVEVEDNFEFLWRGVDDIDGINEDGLGLAVGAKKVHLPLGFDQDVACVEGRFAEADERGGLAAEAFKELLAAGQGGGEIGGVDGLGAMRTGGHEDVGKPGEDGGQVHCGTVVLERIEELGDGCGGLVHERPPVLGCSFGMQKIGSVLSGTLVLYQIITIKSTPSAIWVAGPAADDVELCIFAESVLA